MDAPREVAKLPGGGDIGNDQAVTDLVVALYSELRKLASRCLQRERSDHTLQTTALVHEAYLRFPRFAAPRPRLWSTRIRRISCARDTQELLPVLPMNFPLGMRKEFF